MGPGFAAIGKLKGIEPMATKYVRWILVTQKNVTIIYIVPYQVLVCIRDDPYRGVHSNVSDTMVPTTQLLSS